MKEKKSKGDERSRISNEGLTAFREKLANALAEHDIFRNDEWKKHVFYISIRMLGDRQEMVNGEEEQPTLVLDGASLTEQQYHVIAAVDCKLALEDIRFPNMLMNYLTPADCFLTMDCDAGPETYEDNEATFGCLRPFMREKKPKESCQVVRAWVEQC